MRESAPLVRDAERRKASLKRAAAPRTAPHANRTPGRPSDAEPNTQPKRDFSILLSPRKAPDREHEPVVGRALEQSLLLEREP